jgi:hypothetical protein
VIVIGDGVIKRRGFLRKLQTALQAGGLKAQIRRAALPKNGVAIGAAVLFNKRTK